MAEGISGALGAGREVLGAPSHTVSLSGDTQWIKWEAPLGLQPWPIVWGDSRLPMEKAKDFVPQNCRHSFRDPALSELL